MFRGGRCIVPDASMCIICNEVLSAAHRAPPGQTLEQILGYCPPQSLAALETTCSYFIKSGVTERVARHHLRHIPRAKGLKPDIRRGETYVTLYHFVMAQSSAAAQGTAIALGTYHTVALLCDATERAQRGEAAGYALRTMGRGFHGQLGLGDYEQRAAPSRVPSVLRGRTAVALPDPEIGRAHV